MIYVSKAFRDAMRGLPKDIQGKLNTLLNNVMEGKTPAGDRLHKLENTSVLWGKEKKQFSLQSLSIDMVFRIIYITIGNDYYMIRLMNHKRYDEFLKHKKLMLAETFEKLVVNGKNIDPDYPHPVFLDEKTRHNSWFQWDAAGDALQRVILSSRQQDILQQFSHAAAGSVHGATKSVYPTILKGTAGSGKSMILLEVMGALQKAAPGQKILYTTKSPHLCEVMRSNYEKMNDDTDIPDFLAFSEFDNRDKQQHEQVIIDETVFKEQFNKFCWKQYAQHELTNIWRNLNMFFGSYIPIEPEKGDDFYIQIGQITDQDSLERCRSFINDRLHQLRLQKIDSKMIAVEEGDIARQKEKLQKRLLEREVDWNLKSRLEKKLQLLLSPSYKPEIEQSALDDFFSFVEKDKKTTWIQNILERSTDANRKQWDLIIVDEAQDLHQLQLLWLLYKLKGNEKYQFENVKIVLAGDMEQQTLLHLESWESMVQRLSLGKIKFTSFQLDLNFRNSKLITEMVNSCIRIKKELRKTIKGRQISDIIKTVDGDTRKAIIFDNLNVLLEKGIDYHTAREQIIIADEKSANDLRHHEIEGRAIKTVNIWTIAATRGHEFSGVILYNFFSTLDAGSGKESQALRKNIIRNLLGLETPLGELPNSEEEIYTIIESINKFYISISRSYGELYFLENDPETLRFIRGCLDGSCRLEEVGYSTLMELLAATSIDGMLNRVRTQIEVSELQANPASAISIIHDVLNSEKFSQEDKKYFSEETIRLLESNEKLFAAALFELYSKNGDYLAGNAIEKAYPEPIVGDPDLIAYRLKNRYLQIDDEETGENNKTTIRRIIAETTTSAGHSDLLRQLFDDDQNDWFFDCLEKAYPSAEISKLAELYAEYGRWQQAGDLYFESQDFRRAEEAYQACPDRKERRALCLEKLEEYGAAAALYEEINTPATLLMAAQLYRKAGQTKKCIAAFQRLPSIEDITIYMDAFLESEEQEFAKKGKEISAYFLEVNATIDNASRKERLLELKTILYGKKHIPEEIIDAECRELRHLLEIHAADDDFRPVKISIEKELARFPALAFLVEKQTIT